MNRAAPFCVIRKFKDGDQHSIKQIITEATMEQVGNFFWGAVLSEAILQVAVVVMAISFIFIGIPFKYCLFAIPFAFVILYMMVWSGHWIKATELNGDLDNIHAHYLNDPGTTFLVAEVYGRGGEAELAAIMNKVKKVEYQFYTKEEFEVQQVNTKGLTPTVVGSLAVTRSTYRPNWAWIRRVAVKKSHRRQHLATTLLGEAIKFCRKGDYKGIELVTTECHTEARDMYYREGFESLDVTTRSYMGFGASQSLRMALPLNRPAESDLNVDNDQKDETSNLV